MQEPLGPVFVEFNREDEDVQSFRMNAKSLPELDINWSALTQEERNVEHFGARFLAAAVLACFTNTLWNALKAEGATPKAMRGRASTHKEKDSLFRTRYDKVLLSVEVELEPGKEEIFEAVRDHLDMGSLMTYSLPDGIEVEHDVQQV